MSLQEKVKMLHFRKFGKHYGSFPALKIDELAIPPGIYWVGQKRVVEINCGYPVVQKGYFAE